MPENFGEKEPNVEEEKIQRMEEYKRGYESMADKRFKADCTDEDRDRYDIAQFDVYSHDTEIAMACFETFQSPSNLFVIEQIISNTENEEVKTELARLMEPTENIGSFESHPDVRLDKESQRKSLAFQVGAHQKAIESMIEHSSGETRMLFERKLKEFEDFVQALELEK